MAAKLPWTAGKIGTGTMEMGPAMLRRTRYGAAGATWTQWTKNQRSKKKLSQLHDPLAQEAPVVVPAPLNQHVPARTTTAASPPRAPCKKEAARTAIAPAMARDLGAGEVPWHGSITTDLFRQDPRVI